MMPAAHEPAFVVTSKLGGDVNGNRGEQTTTSQSRSTSAGSMSVPPSPPEHSQSAAFHACHPAVPAFPEFEYPVPYAIRNTFVDTGIGRPLSLEEFYEERRVHSCPVEPSDGHEQLQRAMTTGGSMMASVAAAAAAASAAAAAATMCWMTSPARRGDATPSSPAPVDPTAIHWGATATPMSASPAAQAPVLRLADWMPEPELGSPEMPTVGSAGHSAGTCKPCAFFHSKGCGNGVNCSFCHLCPADEKKRRQKEKICLLREMRRMGSQA